jgi:hypothetical protein
VGKWSPLITNQENKSKNLLYSNNSSDKRSLSCQFWQKNITYMGIKQLMAGGGVALIGTQLIPLLGSLFG